MQRTLGCLTAWAVVVAALVGGAGRVQGAEAGAATYRLYEGVTVYVHNPDGVAFDVRLELRDLNLMAQGPREVLFKVYDPDGRPVVREIIPDDGVTTAAFAGPAGGWADEFQYYASLYVRGTKPSYRWSAWSEPGRLSAVAARRFDRRIGGGAKGVYRIVLAGASDHYVTVTLTPGLRHGVAGHPTWLHGHGAGLARSYIYVPPDTVGVFFAIAEPDRPETRTFRLSGPDGDVLFEGRASGGYRRSGGRAHSDTTIKFADPAAYAGKLLTLDVSDGPGDYLVKVTLQQPKEGIFKEYLGMGSMAVHCPDPETAMAIRGGTFVEDGLLFWHPFQARFHRWLKEHPLDGSDEERALRGELQAIFDRMRLLETSDGRGSAVWMNWSYGFGYYGFRIWRRAWLLMGRADVPEDIKAIVREGLIMAGDRLSFAVSGEAVNGNAFAQTPVALWYGHRATGDALQKERFEVFWDRWTREGWGPRVGLSPSGDAQEFFGHDMHYGSYIMDNWKPSGNTWVKEGGILGDAVDDPRFREVMERYYELYSFLYCREANGRAVAANPWSARTHMHPHNQAANWEVGPHAWKGEPGPDLTANVNGGSEWFAARRAGYYVLTFHGRLPPDWTSRSFPGQLGFGGGIICQFTVPGKGPVLASRQAQSYGTGMHPSNWRNMRIHSVVGETWDGRPLISAISEHGDARLDGNTVTSSGEVRDAHVRVFRRYTYGPESVECDVRLEESESVEILSIFSWERYWSEVKTAYELIPFMPMQPGGKVPTEVTLLGAGAEAIGAADTELREAHGVRIDRGGFGVDVRFEEPRAVMVTTNSSVLVRIVEAGATPVAARDVALRYRLVPFGW